jgi:hypothetical protein
LNKKNDIDASHHLSLSHSNIEINKFNIDFRSYKIKYFKKFKKVFNLAIFENNKYFIKASMFILFED